MLVKCDKTFSPKQRLEANISPCPITGCFYWMGTVSGGYGRITLFGKKVQRSNGTAAINAQKTHCKHGHAFDHKNTGFSSFHGTHRYCRECLRIRSIEKRRRKREAA